MKKGFTLVELSIVLVIIGLLIGGILIAQSMISTSKITAEAAQLEQFDAGVANFKTKYKYLPGDAPAFGGDGDGGIAGRPGTQELYGFQCEIANFWSNIDLGKFPGMTTCTWVIKANLQGTSKNVPLAAMGGKNSYFIAASDGGGGSWITPPITNYYVMLGGTQAQSLSSCAFGTSYFYTQTSASNSAATPEETLALDKKIDDGLANSGNVKSGGISVGFSGFCGGPTATPTAGLCSSGSSYILTHSGYECTPMIRIGGLAGDQL